MDIGTVYPNTKQFRLTMKQFEINEEFEFHLVKTDKKRYIAAVAWGGKRAWGSWPWGLAVRATFRSLGVGEERARPRSIHFACVRSVPAAARSKKKIRGMGRRGIKGPQRHRMAF